MQDTHRAQGRFLVGMLAVAALMSAAAIFMFTPLPGMLLLFVR